MKLSKEVRTDGPQVGTWEVWARSLRPSHLPSANRCGTPFSFLGSRHTGLQVMQPVTDLPSSLDNLPNCPFGKYGESVLAQP